LEPLIDACEVKNEKLGMMNEDGGNGGEAGEIIVDL
jgi:hypothetical protein